MSLTLDPFVINFSQSVPGQEDLCELFTTKMSDPESLHRTRSSHESKLRSIVHGDLWHNNIFFKHAAAGSENGGSKDTDFVMVEWNMSRVGNATNDLCFFLFSSTTPAFRRDHWDSTLLFYYKSLLAVIRSLGVDESVFALGYDEFLADIKVSTPLSLFFCGNIQDLEVSSEATSVRHDPSFACLAEAGTNSGGVEETFQRLQSCFNILVDPWMAEEEPPSPMKSVYKTAEDAEGGISISFGSGGAKLSNGDEFGESHEERVEATTIPEEEASKPRMFALGQKGMYKVPTIATDSDLAYFESLKKRNKAKCNKIDARRARALRRKLYLDLYREAATKGLI